jgi:ubiquinone biosynthesis protein COQ9
MSTFRTQILRNALPLIPTKSFTRQTLLTSLSSLPPSSSTAPSSTHTDHDAILDTIFGAGPSAPAKALLEAWEQEGATQMQKLGEIEERLEERLAYSAEVGEHLGEVSSILCGSDPC